MIRLARQAFQVSLAYPSNRGRFAGWDWETYFLAVLTVLKEPTSIYAYSRAINGMQNLPREMIFTDAILTAAWARFNMLYKGFNQATVYRVMEDLARNTGRYDAKDKSQWFTIEQEWQALDRAENFNNGVDGWERTGGLGLAQELSETKYVMTPMVEKYYSAFVSIMTGLEGQSTLKLQDARQIYINQKAKATTQELIDTYQAVISAIEAKIVTVTSSDWIKITPPDFSKFTSDDWRQYYPARTSVYNALPDKMIPNNSLVLVFAEGESPRFNITGTIDGFNLPPVNDHPIIPICSANGKLPDCIPPGDHTVSVNYITYGKLEYKIKVAGSGKDIHELQVTRRIVSTKAPEYTLTTFLQAASTKVIDCYVVSQETAQTAYKTYSPDIDYETFIDRLRQSKFIVCDDYIGLEFLNYITLPTIPYTINKKITGNEILAMPAKDYDEAQSKLIAKALEYLNEPAMPATCRKNYAASELVYFAKYSLAFRGIKRAMEQTRENKNAVANIVINDLINSMGLSMENPALNTYKREDFVIRAFTQMRSLFIKEMAWDMNKESETVSKLKANLGIFFDVIFLGKPMPT